MFSSSYSTNVLNFTAMNSPAYIYTVDEYGELPDELTHRPLPFSAPYPFASASFYPRFFVPTGPPPMRMDTTSTGLEYRVTAASFLTSIVKSSTRRSALKSMSQVFLGKIQASVSPTFGLERRIGSRVVR